MSILYESEFPGYYDKQTKESYLALGWVRGRISWLIRHFAESGDVSLDSFGTLNQVDSQNRYRYTGNKQQAYRLIRTQSVLDNSGLDHIGTRENEEVPFVSVKDINDIRLRRSRRLPWSQISMIIKIRSAHYLKIRLWFWSEKEENPNHCEVCKLTVCGFLWK